MLDIEQQIAYWVASASEDLSVAESLLEKGHNLHSAFFAELAVEKALKALVVKQTKDVPPYIHNLLRLAELTGISMGNEHLIYYSNIQRYCIEGRYPKSLKIRISPSDASGMLKRCKEEVQWLIQQL